jgi:RNA polymerase sigma factor (sigma-70 family)
MSPEPRLDPLEDSRLVDLCLSGDPGAWEDLVRRHERLVYAVARSYRLSDTDLGDVFQEVFAALVQGLPRLRQPRALVRWLSSTSQRIARATALRRRREQALAAGPEELPRVAASEPAIGADLERLEDQALVRLSLAALAPRCRRLLEALYYEDPTPAYAEIGRRLGIPVGSIGPTRARCFERLRAALAALDAVERISERGTPTFESGTGGPGGLRVGAFGDRTGLSVQEDRA